MAGEIVNLDDVKLLTQEEFKIGMKVQIYERAGVKSLEKKCPGVIEDIMKGDEETYGYARGEDGVLYECLSVFSDYSVSAL